MYKPISDALNFLSMVKKEVKFHRKNMYGTGWSETESLRKENSIWNRRYGKCIRHE